MGRLALLIPLAVVTQIYADESVATDTRNTQSHGNLGDRAIDVLINKLADKLLNTAFTASPLLLASLDNTTFGKPGHANMAVRVPSQSAIPHGLKTLPPRSCPIPNGLYHHDANSVWMSYWPVPQKRNTMVFSATTPAEGATAEKRRPRPGERKGFIEEMRMVAMRLHTKDQAPKEGKKEAPKNRPKFAPTREGYLSFLVESKIVYDALETLMATASHPSYANFQNTGLERSAALEKDIDTLTKEYGLQVPIPDADGPGRTYADLLTKLAVDDPPAFMCHFYNVYFAHSAGGRMIGKMVSDSVLDGKQLAFYEYEGEMKDLLEKVKEKINAGAEEWSREEKDHCLEETEKSFKYSGALLRCIMPNMR
eukprot:gnl/MRDRNA2_/MRDRNA2_91274_c0_seq1.p1 gnl/MRDRNA2_/MRDRNA2_91274_c0~~gnl/MRDRNA2_/MRDRNA2_91274_c0_seq1.p1  ORF type:complete len:367 (-),score=64.37 gnl/MRDRNA2_/MRDRNA2_91274_c0_seq1:86-1186(-)